jgi:cytochrome c oxidase subunit III
MPVLPVNEIEIIEVPASDRGGGGELPPDRPGDDRRGDDFAGEFFKYRVPQRAYVTGIIVAASSMLMFFMSLVSAFVVRRGLENGTWHPIQMPRILWLNTLILIASSVTLIRSRHFLRARDHAGFRHWWGVTAILGIFFLAGQLIAWRQLFEQGVYLAGNAASGFFYFFTAAHGLHLLGGVAALLVVAFRAPRRLSQATATEVISIYWHFLDAMWLFLFLFLLFSYRTVPAAAKSLANSSDPSSAISDTAHPSSPDGAAFYPDPPKPALPSH